MTIAKCPTCGNEIGIEDIEDPITRLAMSLSALLITASMVRVALADPDHAPALHGFLERLRELSSVSEKEVEELIEWGGAYDGEEEED